MLCPGSVNVLYVFFRLPLPLASGKEALVEAQEEALAVCWNHSILAARTDCEILINFSSGLLILGTLKSMTLKVFTIWKLANTTNWGFILQRESLIISTPLNQRISPPSLSLCASGTASSRDDAHLWLQLWVENFPVRSASHQVYWIISFQQEAPAPLFPPFLEVSGRSFLLLMTSGWLHNPLLSFSALQLPI